MVYQSSVVPCQRSREAIFLSHPKIVSSLGAVFPRCVPCLELCVKFLFGGPFVKVAFLNWTWTLFLE